MIRGVIHVWVWDQIIRALFTQMVAAAPQKVSRQTWCSSHALHLCFQRWRGRCPCVRAERSWSSEECWRRSLRKVDISEYFRSLPNDLIIEIKVETVCAPSDSRVPGMMQDGRLENGLPSGSDCDRTSELTDRQRTGECVCVSHQHSYCFLTGF